MPYLGKTRPVCQILTCYDHRSQRNPVKTRLWVKLAGFRKAKVHILQCNDHTLTSVLKYSHIKAAFLFNFLPLC